MTLAVLSLSVSVSAHAAEAFAFLSAQKLHDKLHGGNAERAIATGYIEGVADTLIGEIPVLCLPSDVKLAQLIALVKNYLDAHPDEWNMTASGVVMEALTPHYECKRHK